MRLVQQIGDGEGPNLMISQGFIVILSIEV